MKSKVENGEVIEKALENIKKRNITFAIDASHMYIIEDELTNALNQQRELLIKEIREQLPKNIVPYMSTTPVEEPIMFDQSDYYVDLGRQRMLQELKEFLTKLEK